MLLALVMVFGLMPMTQITASAAWREDLALATKSLTPGSIYSLASGSVTNVSYTIPAGAAVTVYVDGNTTIDNTNAGGSPFTVVSGGTLKLIVRGTLTVKGQKAGDGTNGSETGMPAYGGNGGDGGYAGIAVPAGATLFAKGIGTINAYGGAAGNGGNGGYAVSGYTDGGGAGGGGGAGAGIGGNGGGGGAGGAGGLGGGLESNWTYAGHSGAGGAAGVGATEIGRASCRERVLIQV